MANQTVNLPLKSLMARLASSRVVLWALATHRPRLVEIFNGPLGRSLPAEQRESFDEHIANLRTVLTTARDVLIASDRKLRDQKVKTTSYRRSRDEAFKELSPWVMGIKDIFRGACGDSITAELGFALRMPVQAAELHEQAVHLLDRLSAPEELPAIRYQGVTLDPLTMALETQPKVDRLGETLEELSREERQSEAMKIAKDEALTAFDDSFRWVANSAESLFRLAKLPEVAKRVRPSTRRPGVTVEVANEGPEVPIEEPVAANDDGVNEVPDVPAKARPDVPPTQ